MMTPRDAQRRAHKYRMLANELHADLLGRRSPMPLPVRECIVKAAEQLELAVTKLEGEANGL